MGEEKDRNPNGEGELLSWARQTQRNIDFIVRQQAQFAAGMQQLREAQARSDEKWAHTEEGIRSLLAIAEMHEREIVELREAQARLTESQDRTDRQLTELAKRMAETDRRMAETARQMAETDRRMAETAARMAETDERINALVNFVERLASDKRDDA